MKINQKGITPIIIALIVAVVLGGGYFIVRQQAKNSPKVENTTVSTATVTSDWKTYADANMGVSVKYPSSWTYQEFSCNLAGVAFCPLAGNSLLNCKQTCGMNSPASPIYLYNNGNKTAKTNLELKSTDYEYKKIYDQMLSTFKFTSPSMTSDWKTYKNEKYGFEFKYPTYLGNPVDSVGQIEKLDCNSKAYIEVSLAGLGDVGLQLACPVTANGNSYKGNREVVVVAGQNSFNFDYTTSTSYHNNEVYIPLNKNLYLLIGYSRKSGQAGPMISDKDFKTLLSTFKFTSPDPKLSVTLLSPNGGETWKIGNTYAITWNETGELGTKTIRLNKYSDDSVRIGEETIGTTLANTFSYTVSSTVKPTNIDTPKYKIQIIVDKYNTGMGVADDSDNYLTITN